MRLAMSLIYIAVIGILSHFIGEALPRRWFSAEKIPFKPFSWEKNGKVYLKLGVHRWKDKLPDMSRILPDMVRKSISLTDGSAAAERVTKETCVAETVHWALFLLSGGIRIIYPTLLGWLISIGYALSHIPFIIIQRYNRPTLNQLAKRLREREERKGSCTC